MIFEFPRNIQYSDGEAKKGTVITFSPEAPGTIEYHRNSSALAYTPSSGFELGTTYTVTAADLTTADSDVG